jgi:hypothetical protein
MLVTRPFSLFHGLRENKRANNAGLWFLISSETLISEVRFTQKRQKWLLQNFRFSSVKPTIAIRGHDAAGREVQAVQRPVPAAEVKIKHSSTAGEMAH